MVYYLFLGNIPIGGMSIPLNAKHIVAIGVAAILLIAGLSLTFTGNDNTEKKGLYALDVEPTYIEKGGISVTPRLVDSIEHLYESVYGSIDSEELTLNDARDDKVFWDQYADYKPYIRENDDGTITFTSTGTVVPKCDRLIATGTMYPATLYHLICLKHGETPYSEDALKNEDLVSEFQWVMAGGMTLDFIHNNTDLEDYYDELKYLDLGANTISKVDPEKVGELVSILSADGSKVIFMGSGSTVASSADYDLINKISVNTGGVGAIFPVSSTIPQALAGIEMIGTLFGYKDQTQPLIEDMQLRMYKVYSALKDVDTDKKVYWEGVEGKSSKITSMGKQIMDFFGWDTSMNTGKEVDTETILMEKPDIILFFTHDSRSLDDRMRA